MPGYIIHLTEAQLILSILEKKSDFIYKNDKEWKKIFEYGVLLPDAKDKKYKEKSHFWNEGDKGKIVRTPDLSAYLKSHSINVSDPLSYGYFAHLHLDKVFFEEYLNKYIMFLNSSGEEEIYMDKVSSVKIRESGELIPVNQFFSDKYLYGDYTKINLLLINKYHITLPDVPVKKDQNIMKMQKQEFDEFCHIFDKIKNFIEQSHENLEELKVIQIRTLEQFLKKTAREFLLLN